MEIAGVARNLTTPSNEHLVKNDMNRLWSIINMVSIVAYSLVFVLGTAGNGLVIFITGFRMKKTVNTVWILNLAIADFTCSFFQLFNIVYTGLAFHWPFGNIMCRLNHTIVFLNLFASIFLLTVISVDRCISVRCPVWAQNRRTPRLASFVVLGVWILALVVSSPHLYFKDIYKDAKTNKPICRSTYSKLDGGGTIYYAVVLIRFLFGFIIPFILIVVCYGAIVVRLRRHQLSQSSRPFKVITAVIVAFFVCWFPFHVFYFLKAKTFYYPSKPVVVSVGLRLSYCLAFFNSCLNPILYFCMGHNFKERLRCSLLSTMANAFAEEGNLRATNTRARSSAELESYSL